MVFRYEPVAIVCHLAGICVRLKRGQDGIRLPEKIDFQGVPLFVYRIQLCHQRSTFILALSRAHALDGVTDNCVIQVASADLRQVLGFSFRSAEFPFLPALMREIPEHFAAVLRMRLTESCAGMQLPHLGSLRPS